jgi:hypothetical protein
MSKSAATRSLPTAVSRARVCCCLSLSPSARMCHNRIVFPLSAWTKQDPLAHRNLARLLDATGNTRDSLLHNRIALRLGPGHLSEGHLRDAHDTDTYRTVARQSVARRECVICSQFISLLLFLFVCAVGLLPMCCRIRVQPFLFACDFAARCSWYTALFPLHD